MELMGLTLYCFMWQRMLAAAYKSKAQGRGDLDHLDALIKTGQFFIVKQLPKAKALAEEISSGADTLMAMTAEQF
jgi:acyl-CoA dehydrogenase